MAYVASQFLLIFLGMSISLIGMDPSSSLSDQKQRQEEQKRIQEIQGKLNQQMKELEEQEESARKALHRTSQKALYTGAFLGAGCGFPLAQWAYRFIVRPAIRNSAPNRFFTGLEVPAALSTIKAVLTPLACLALFAYGYYAVKNYFVEPYMREHKEQWERNREIILKEKAEIAQSNQAFMIKMQNEVGQLRTNVVATQTQVDKELEKMQTENNQLRNALREVTSKTSVDLAGIQTQVSELGKTNVELKEKVAEVSPKVNTLLVNVQKMSKHISEELQVMQSQGEAIKKLQTEMKNKKDKKEKRQSLSDLAGLFSSNGSHSNSSGNK